jgi:hypothetical protein
MEDIHRFCEQYVMGTVMFYLSLAWNNLWLSRKSSDVISPWEKDIISVTMPDPILRSGNR